MNATRHAPWSVVLGLALLSGLGACDPGGGFVAGQLSAYGESTIALQAYESREIAVRYADSAGYGLTGATVNFQIDGQTGGATLGTPASQVDGQGLARTVISAAAPGAFTLMVSAPGAQPLYLPVTITDPGNTQVPPSIDPNLNPTTGQVRVETVMTQPLDLNQISSSIQQLAGGSSGNPLEMLLGMIFQQGGSWLNLLGGASAGQMSSFLNQQGATSSVNQQQLQNALAMINSVRDVRLQSTLTLEGTDVASGQPIPIRHQFQSFTAIVNGVQQTFNLQVGAFLPEAQSTLTMQANGYAAIASHAVQLPINKQIAEYVLGQTVGAGGLNGAAQSMFNCNAIASYFEQYYKNLDPFGLLASLLKNGVVGACNTALQELLGGLGGTNSIAAQNVTLAGGANCSVAANGYISQMVNGQWTNFGTFTAQP